MEEGCYSTSLGRQGSGTDRRHYFKALRRFYLDIGKRVLDLLLALFLSISLSWLLILIALVYLLLREKDIIFKQARTGRGAKPFLLYKFRTLSHDIGLPLKDRRFPWGSFLRRTSLDEVPQLMNVLKGEMSLVGPRPLPVEYLSLYTSKQAKRHEVRPGITGLAQTNGRNSITWQQKFDFDLYYVDHVSFWLDIRIILKTAMILLSFRKDVSLYEEKFAGDE